MSSVRQLIISINVANTNKETDRPIVFFYDGPEKGTINQATGKAITGESVRQSQPVILNLNKDFRGILFAPNSPVVINGNGHKFEGFVVAKEYKKLLTEDDFEPLAGSADGAYIKIADKAGARICRRSRNITRSPRRPSSTPINDLTFSGNPFNLSSYKYNSFLLVGLVNYTYLDKKAGGSDDAFFTTARSKHVD